MRIDPGPLTLRELVWMADGVRRDQWLHTSSLMALIANTSRDPKKKRKPYEPDDFNPFAGSGRERRKRRRVKGTINDLKVLLPHG